MKWGPRKFNDTLALLVLGATFALFAFLLWASVAQGYELQGAGMIVGALITWGGMVYSFYYRKNPPQDPPEGMP